MTHEPETQQVAAPVEGEIERFWADARVHARLDGIPSYFGPTPLAALTPPSWAFGDDPELADRLLGLVLEGAKTAMASAREDYPSEDDLPESGRLSILLDSAGHPRALIGTTEVRVVPFDEVTAEHARAEGDGSLEAWREEHEAWFAAHSPGGFRPDMPVVLESFTLLHPATESRATLRAMFGG